MSILHHPDVATLMSCAAGSQPEAIAAVVASHLAMCPSCAREVGKMTRIGAALFDDLAPAAMEKAASVAAMRAQEAETEVVLPAEVRTGDVPYPLTGLIGTDLDKVAWKWLAPGVWYYPVPLSDGATGDLRLLKVAPGQAVPEHGHGGEELTLLLRGSYRDELGEFRTGDVADLDDDVEHTPIADPKEGCICLVASETKARFKSLFARIVQPLTGM
jgi:putative transcriptional regulator